LSCCESNRNQGGNTIVLVPLAIDISRQRDEYFFAQKILGGILMTKTHSPFRYDVVGSFLRPDYLLKAREDFKNNEITKEELKDTEDRAIIELINRQEEIGLKAVTDGEFRRSWWHLDFFWGLHGIKKEAASEGYSFNGVETRAEAAVVTGKISGENHPFIDHFKFTRKHTSNDVEVKQTIPAPAQFIFELLFSTKENRKNTEEFYPDIDDLIDDIADAYLTVLNDFKKAGATVVQLDDTSWSQIVNINPEDSETEEEKQEKIDQQNTYKKLFLKANNAVYNRAPEGLVINSHVCRGNYRSTWFASGGYDSVAEELLGKEKLNAYYLEYDSDRSGGFEPLKEVTDNKQVVLGLITSKDPELEDRQAIIDRIKEASEYVPLENLHLSPQCGFSSTEEGNILTEDDQWKKLKLIKSIAEEVWEDA